MNKRKVFTAAVSLKADAEPGTLIAKFAQLNVKDSDGDVTLPGAFGEQQVRVQPYGHDTRHPSIGKGTIREDGEAAIFEGQLNLKMAAGREVYESLKFDMENGDGPLTEFSYIYDIVDSETGEHEGEKVQFLKALKVHSVDPVFLGAGVDTGLVGVKEHKQAIAPHSTATSDRPWDAAANVAAISNDAGAETFRALAAWRDPEGDPDVKGSYKFWHHFPGDKAASMRACSNGIGVLNGGRGGTGIPAGDRQGVHAHLARHMMDADMEPPDLKDADDPPSFVELAETAQATLREVTGFIDQAEALVASLSERGEQLTDAKTEAVSGLCAEVSAINDRMVALLKSVEAAAEADPPGDPSPSWRLRLAELDVAMREVPVSV